MGNFHPSSIGLKVALVAALAFFMGACKARDGMKSPHNPGPQGSGFQVVAQGEKLTPPQLSESDKILQKMKALRLYKDLRFGVEPQSSPEVRHETYLRMYRATQALRDELIPIHRRYEGESSLEFGLCLRFIDNSLDLLRHTQGLFERVKGEGKSPVGDHLLIFARWLSLNQLMMMQHFGFQSAKLPCFADPSEYEKVDQAFQNMILAQQQYSLSTWGALSVRETLEFLEKINQGWQEDQEEGTEDLVVGLVAGLGTMIWPYLGVAKLMTVIQQYQYFRFLQALAEGGRLSRFGYHMITFTGALPGELLVYRYVTEPLTEDLTNPGNEYVPQYDEDLFIDTQQFIEAFVTTDLDSPGIYEKTLAPLLKENLKESFETLEKYEKSVEKMVELHGWKHIQDFEINIEKALEHYQTQWLSLGSKENL